MPTSTEIINAFIGAWKIARRDPSALSHFDFSADAFWRSFAAFIFATPFYLVFISAEWRMIGDADIVVTNSLLGYTTIEFLSYVAFWVLYPLSMVFICRRLNLTHQFAPYIIVFNWSSVLVAVLLAPPYVLYSFGIATIETSAFLILLVFVTALLYHWQIAVTAFRTTSATAAGIVAFEVALGFMINMVASSFLGVGPQ
ncbi:hypothetical protein RHODOSMS8_03583 [Rhodobiaceae bacterium]|nr:hypothetical protein RHODOSMS8_03583 [Rhodobiaceae bacterium]